MDKWIWVVQGVGSGKRGRHQKIPFLWDQCHLWPHSTLITSLEFTISKYSHDAVWGFNIEFVGRGTNIQSIPLTCLTQFNVAPERPKSWRVLKPDLIPMHRMKKYPPLWGKKHWYLQTEVYSSFYEFGLFRHLCIHSSQVHTDIFIHIEELILKNHININI